MPILTIRHVTTYHYRRPVAFGEHRMMLRPRDDDDQKVLEIRARNHARAEPTATGRGISSAITSRPPVSRTRACELRFESTIRRRSRAGRLPRRRYRRSMPVPIRLPMRRKTGQVSPASSRRRSPHPELDRWAAEFLRADGSADTHALLVGMTQTIKRTFRHGARHQKGTQDPVRTLELASGSCRDLAVLMIAGAALAWHRGAVRVRISAILPMHDDDTRHRRQHPCLGPGLRSRPRLGRLRSVERHGREREPRARRGGRTIRARQFRCKDVDRERVGPSRHEGRRQGHRGGRMIGGRVTNE